MIRMISIAIAAALLAGACAYLPQVRDTGLTPAGKLRPCPTQPHCVSSADSNPDRHVEPLPAAPDPRAAWHRAVAHLTQLPRSRVAALTDTYARIEITSKLLRFVDDVELQLDPAADVIGVRSSSRIGYWDGGVNRVRVERLRAALSAARSPP